MKSCLDDLFGEITMTDTNVQHEKYKAPVTIGSQLKPGDRITCIVLGPNDDKGEKLTQIYNTDMMVIQYDPAPPAIEPRCEVEVDLGDGCEPLVGTVIAIYEDQVWVRGRLTGDGVYPKANMSVIRTPKK